MSDSVSYPHIAGVYAAVLTPRVHAGPLDLLAFEGQLHFLSKQNLQGFAVNRATGECPGTTLDELGLLLASAFRVAPNHKVLCGVGASNLPGILVSTISLADSRDSRSWSMPPVLPE